ncbi:hypothetical protein DEU35_3268 [Microbacterium sp. AG157]|uniref:hypothetical protein n=1 Tax=Microbacterium sp. AG157 TaxID=2183993 RepID=UPI000E252858|nr:hypothetical protein [Microbacterium sp. AG157]REC96788.1 hypothetical protein DEU35_3268 [Microbacterium sp. AG157]
MPPIPERIRDGLAASAAERASAHEDRRKGIEDAESLFAAHDDDGGVSPSLGALGYARVSSGRDGRTIWDSDPAQKHQASYASREATRIREECVRESIRHALSAARRLGVFDPADVDLGPAREAGNERADAILAALAA